MTTTKSSLSFVISMSLLAGTALLAGCSQPESKTTTSEVTTAPPPPVASTSSTTQYRRQ
jgi:uncharacterized lipoprotein YajG